MTDIFDNDQQDSRVYEFERWLGRTLSNEERQLVSEQYTKQDYLAKTIMERCEGLSWQDRNNTMQQILDQEHGFSREEFESIDNYNLEQQQYDSRVYEFEKWLGRTLSNEERQLVNDQYIKQDTMHEIIKTKSEGLSRQDQMVIIQDTIDEYYENKEYSRF